jgi:hypothetical protein
MKLLPTAALMLMLVLPKMPAAEVVDLAGRWRVTLDPRDAGRADRWFARELTSPTIALPGSVQAARLGEPVTPETKWTGGIFDKSYFSAPQYAPYRQPGNVKVPFWLQPETHYTGIAWYQRDIEVPVAWTGKRVRLSLERPHWKTTVWLDEREIGSNDSLSVAHVFELGADLAPGRHRLTVRVDNRLDPDIGENSHSLSDHTQGNWNGIAGRLELSATAPVWIDELQVFPRVAERAAAVRGRIGRAGDQAPPAGVDLEIDGTPAAVSTAPGADGTFAAVLPLRPDAALWDEFNPALHRLVAKLPNGETCEVVFGLREFRAESRQFAINGRPVFLRGTLECAAHPRTGHPPTDVATWKRVLGVVKAHGLNHVRFHSWCPPEAAFVAADELGVYCQIEVASWPNQSTTLGDGKPVDAWLEAETARIIRAYGNHPSFIMLAAGNEPGGEHFAAWLSQWVARWKAADPRRLYTSAAGWPELPENDYHVTPEPRIQHWGEGLRSRINARPPETVTDYGDFIRTRSVPVVSHEIGQWCAYPNFAEMPKYTGYLKPRNFEIFRASLEAHGLAAQAHDFLMASGRLQALCYKEDIESALRTPQMGGFQLLGLSDFPGQGTAPVGVLDAFWEDKGYITAGEFRRFCNSTVPLARLAKRVFTADEPLGADVEVAHFGPAPLAQMRGSWRLQADDGRVVLGGAFPVRDLTPGARNELGRIAVPLAGVPTPARYRLVVALESSGDAAGGRFENDWDVWVYPPAEQVGMTAPPGVTIATSPDAATLQKAESGGAVVLLIPPAEVAPDPARGPVALGFSSIFWNTAWTNGQAPHTLGILCDPKAPALAAFPTDPWSNWQWWYPVSQAAAMILDALPHQLRPTVQVIDDWFTNRKLALVFEARLGRGRLLVTSVDLAGPELDPVRRQLRASLLAYAAGPRFQPAVAITREQVQALFAHR